MRAAWDGATTRIPIRWRLTLWYVALLAVALALFAAGLYFGLRYLLYTSLDTALRNHSAQVRGALDWDGTTLQVSAGQLVDPADDGRFVRVYDNTGRLLVDTSADADDGDPRPPNPAGVAAALQRRSDLRWVDDDEDHLRLLSEPLVRGGAVVGVVEVGKESEVDETLGLALRLILLAAPLVLVVAAASGVWLAGRALAPIDRITRTAAAIEERDLTQRISLRLPNDEVGRLATTFNAMLDRIETAFGRQRRFTADAAHELRTPLALMRSQIELALAQPRDPAADRQTLEALEADVLRLTRLATALLALARSDARGLELHPERLDLAELLELAAEQYASLAEEAGVTLRVEAEPVALTADEDLLLQVLVNLLDNALRHSPAGTTITMGCRPEGTEALFWVADEGDGIAPEHIPHVFERFYRAHPGRGRDTGGIGLGLSISRSIVEAHGGSINVESTPGAGATFTVRIPRGRG